MDTNLLLVFVSIACFLLGVLTTIGAGLLIERHALARPEARLECAKRMLVEVAAELRMAQ